MRRLIKPPLLATTTTTAAAIAALVLLIPLCIPLADAAIDSPVPVASFDDGDTVTVGMTNKTFDELDQAHDITTVRIGTGTYALVVSLTDSGVQIIDITDPASPVPTASFEDGDTVEVGGTNKTFDKLFNGRDITTVRIGSSTYALVAATLDHGVQIIDITDPANPVPTASFEDGDTVEVGMTNKTFDELRQPYGITTVRIGSSTYALVAANLDDGVQIIDITDPASPVPTASFEDGDTVEVGGTNKTFDELDGARGITTVRIGSSTYALVAAYFDDGVQIIDITDPASPVPTASFEDGDTVEVGGTNKTFDELGKAFGITTVRIGSSTYALVAAYVDDGVQIIDITDPASPVPTASFEDGDTVEVGGTNKTFDELDGAFGITTVRIGSSTYALVAAYFDDGVQIINITDPASPVPTASFEDGDTVEVGGTNKTFDELDGAQGITVVDIGASTYALVASYVDDGVQIIDITNPAIDPPRFVSAELDELTGVLSVTFDKTIDASSVDATMFHIREPESITGGVTLSAPELDTAAIATTDGTALSFTLTGPNRDAVIALDDPQLEIGEGAVADANGTKITAAFDIRTARFAESFAFGTIDNGARAIAFSNDGLRMFLAGINGDSNAYQYALPAAFDVSGASLTRSVTLSDAPFINGIAFSNDGLRMFTVNRLTDTVYQYDLPTAFDVSGASLAQSLNIQSQQTGPTDVAFSNDGHSMFVIGAFEYKIDRYDLPTAFNVTGAEHVGVFSLEQRIEGNVYGLTFSNDGHRMLVTYGLGDFATNDYKSVHQYDLPAAFNTTGASLVGTFDLSPHAPRLRGTAFSNDGLGMFNIDSSNSTVHRYDLRLLYDINRQPVAEAGPNQHVQERDTVTLDGTNSADPDDGDTTLTYSWSQTSGSPAVSLTNANTTSPTFTAPQTGSTAALEFTLTASDSSLSNGTDTVTVTVYDDQTVFARSATYYENHGILGITFNRDIDRLPGILFDLFSIRESGSNSGGSDLASSEWLENTAARSTMIFMLDPSTDDAVRALTSPLIDIEAFAVSGTNGIPFMYDQVELPVVKSGAFLPRVTTAVASAQSEITVRFLSNVDTDITNGTGWFVGASVDVGLEENLAVESNSDPGGMTDTMTLALNGSLPTGFRSGAIFLDYQRPSDDGTGIFNGTEYLGSTNRILLTDGIPPVIVNASAASPTATSITLTFSERITGKSDAESFSLSRTADSATTTPVPAVVSQVEAGSSPTITLNLNGTIGNNDLVIGYNRDLGGDSSMADIAGNPVASFADIPVATPPADPVLPPPPEDDSYAIDSPVPVASITEGQTHSNGKTFDELDGPRDITTVDIGTSTYALVVSDRELTPFNGVQIINITNPENPAPVASITDGQTHSNGKTFDELSGPRGITTVTIGTSTYALVTAYFDQGVQIINITNPAKPVPTASFDDGDTVPVGNATRTFHELRGAQDITTVTISTSTYALVTAGLDDGVQIINITNPAKPVPTASFDDGDRVTVDNANRTFDELDGAQAITTVTIGTSTYALVAAGFDDGVQIIDITNPAKPVPTASFDDGDRVTVDNANRTFDELDGAQAITTVTIGTSTYALVAAGFDDGVQIINITNPASPVPTASFDDGDRVTVDNANRTFDELDGAQAITTVTIGTSTYALVASLDDDGVQIIDITNPANPFPTASFDDGDTVKVGGTNKTFDELDGARAITTVDIGSSTYALVASLTDNGVQIVGISSRSITNQPTVAPTLVSVERHDPATQSTNDTTPTFRATFSKAVTNVDTSDFETAGDATATVSAVTPVSDTVYHVEVNVTADGIVNLGIDAGHNIQDAAGNSLSGTEPTDTDEPYTIDTAPPTLLAVTRIHPAAENTNDRNPIFRVIFGEAVTNVDKEDFETLGNATSTVSSATRIFDTQYDVLVTVTADGTVNLGIDAGHNITDVAGNALSDTTPTGANEPYTIDTVQPTILSIKRHNPLTENTTDSTPTFRVTFSEEVLEVDKPDFAITDSSSANATVSTVTPVPGSTVYDVGVTVTANGTVSLVLAGSHYIIDTASNSLSPADPPVSESYNVSLLPQAENRPPTIDLTGVNPATAERYVAYTDAGAACTDPDGDTTMLASSSNVDTDTVSLPASPYRYTYSCTDQHGLAATNKTRLVSVEDTVKPVITLIGPASVPLTVGDTYTEEGATCTDSGRLLGAASIGGATVDTAVVNEYDVVYACSDGYNNAIPVTRTVTVTEPTPPPPPPPDVNVPPSASISAPPRAAEGTQVTLDGSGSADTDGTIQSYNWTASNPAVAITGSTQPTASFIAPQVTEDTFLAITLKVTDDDGATNSAQHNMTITNVSPPPDDSAAPTFTARTGPATNQITVTFSKNVNSTADSHAAWGVAGSTVTAITGLDGTGNTATLTLQSPVQPPDATPAVTYNADAGSVSDAAGNALATATVTATAGHPAGLHIHLIGDAFLYHTYGEPYTDKGALCHDADGNDITDTGDYETLPYLNQTQTINATLHADTVLNFTHQSQNEYRPFDPQEVTYKCATSPSEFVEESRQVALRDDTPPEIRLNGPRDVDLEIGETFEETATCTDAPLKYQTELLNAAFYLTFRISFLPDGYQDTAGEHTISYTCSDSKGNDAEDTSRTLHVGTPDNTPPVLAVNPGIVTTLANGTHVVRQDVGFAAAGDGGGLQSAVSCTDNRDSTPAITLDPATVDTSVSGAHTITYSCTDAAGNPSNDITVTWDFGPAAPVLAVTPADTQVTLALDASYEIPAASCTDHRDGDITGTGIVTVISSGGQPVDEIDTSSAGTYGITYSCTDSDDNTSEHNVTVTILPAVVDSTPLIVVLNPPEIIFVPVGGSFADADTGALCIDGQGNIIEGRTTVDATALDTAVLGNHTVTYSCTVSEENPQSSTISRTVSVYGFTVNGNIADFATDITTSDDYEEGIIQNITNIENPYQSIKYYDTAGQDTDSFDNQTRPAGTYTVQYTVSTPMSSPPITYTITETVTVVNATTQPDGNTPPIVAISVVPEVEAAEGTLVSLDGTNSRDDDGTISSYAWTTDDASIAITDADRPTASFTAPQVTEDTPLLITLRVTDNEGAPGSAQYTLIITDSESPVVPDTTPPTFTVDGHTGDFETSLTEGQTYRNGKIDNINETGSHPTSTEIRYYSGTGDVITTTDENKISSINNTMPAIGGYTIQYRVSDSAVSPNTHTITETLTVRAPATVTIGAIVSTTGSISSLGIPANDAIHLAVNDFNDRYLAPKETSWRLAVSGYDDGSTSEGAIAALELLAGSNITSIVGPLTSDALSAVKGHALFDEPPRLAISYASTAPAEDLKQKDDRVFRTVPDDSNIVRVYVSLFEADSVDYVIPVFRNDAWGIALNRTLADEIDDHNNNNNNNNEITVHGGILYDPDTVSLSANTTLALLNDTLSRDSVSEKAPAVVVFGFSETLDILDEAAATANLPAAKWYGSDAVAPSKLLEGDTPQDENRRAFLERTDYNVLTLAIDENEANKRIDSSVDNADVYSYAAYDAVYILGTAIHLNGGPAGNMVNEGLIGNIAQVADNTNGHYTDPAMGNTELNEYGDLKQADYFVLSLDPGNDRTPASFEPEFRYDHSSGTLGSLVSSGGGGSSGDVSAPSIRTGFDANQYPLVYDGVKYGPDTIDSPHTATVRAGSGERLFSTLTVYEDGGAQNVRHVDMFVAHDGRTIHNDGTETHVTYDSGNVRITDPHGLIASATVDASAIDATKAQFEFAITFAKKVPLSDVLYRLWDTSRNALYIHLEDALVVSEGRKGGSSSGGGGGGGSGGGSSSSSGGGSSSSSSSSSTATPATGSGNGTTTTTTTTAGNGTAADTADKQQQQQPRQGFTAEQLDTLKQWGGFASQSASDSQLLAQFGIEGTSIPAYFKQTAKWFLDADDGDGGLTAQEFVAALSYLGQRGLLLN